ncbi:L-aspartate oxidase [Cyclobacterium jeungdonense]|uniref:L-aspartate oxidase n=1 Tax=Cyclobacterium jeungdonense TaxID=708087 RepID=A0ABT8C932_9BACT|nr:FAD-dependent oxidoreductase [Cyclobacterium jeungdonense]MDN3688587.1 FAD-dependent oxidoreductase [Cyclobacterium jeungdonense]
MKTDVLIVGSGIAGLSSALHLAESNPDIQVTVLDKSFDQESNTRYAQGGMAAVLTENPDSLGDHIRDTLASGRGFCIPEVVVKVVNLASFRVMDLLRWGVELDKDQKGSLLLGLEGGHSRPRIVHYKDRTGLEIQQKLLTKIKQHHNIKLMRGIFALDLITSRRDEGNQNYCQGVSACNLGYRKVFFIGAKVTILATGGCGQLFDRTTNSTVATGDGLAMAIRGGVKTRDLHFYQIHPTAFFNGRNGKAFLITEALRGAGAHILNHNKERFLFRGDARGELATRDIVTSLIHKEMKHSNMPCVYLDAKHLGREKLLAEFPGVVRYCADQGYDITDELIPVAPAAHYQCGGLETDSKGQSSMDRLFALGECASTGLHGANRLASNSLLEALVFSKNVVETITKNYNGIEIEQQQFQSQSYLQENNQRDNAQKIQSIRFDLKSMMTLWLLSESVTPEKLETFRLKICRWKEIIRLCYQRTIFDPELLELRNLIEVSEAMLIQKNQKKNVEHHPNIHL